MKKNAGILFGKGFVLSGFLIPAFILFTSLFFSCKSGPVGSGLPEVDPLALLQEDSSIYVRIPVQEHKALVQDIVIAELPYISESDATALVKQLDVLYAGLGTVQDRSRLEIVSTGEFPAFARNLIFTKNNGWNKRAYTATSSEDALSRGFPNKFDVNYSSMSAFKVSFLSDGMLLLSQNVNPGLENYALRRDVPETDYSKWIQEGGSDISFYIGKPGQYLRKLIGAAVTVSCDSIFGKLVLLPPRTGKKVTGPEYELEFNVRLNSSQGKAMPMLYSLVSLAMRQMDGVVEKVDDLTLKVTGITASEREIIDLFTMDPITGKHFRVEGDRIFTE